MKNVKARSKTAENTASWLLVNGRGKRGGQGGGAGGLGVGGRNYMFLLFVLLFLFVFCLFIELGVPMD